MLDQPVVSDIGSAIPSDIGVGVAQERFFFSDESFYMRWILFATVNITFAYWFCLFQTEKMSMKLDLLNHIHYHPSDAHKKNKNTTMKSSLTSISVMSASFLYILLLSALLPSSLLPIQLPSLPGWSALPVSLLAALPWPIQCLLASSLSVYSIYLSISVFSDHLNYTLALTAVSLITYYLKTMVVLLVPSLKELNQTPTLELIHHAIIFFALLSTSYKTFFPKLPDIHKFLTKLLQENEIIDKQTSISHFETNLLTGGCHSSVTRLLLDTNIRKYDKSLEKIKNPVEYRKGKKKKTANPQENLSLVIKFLHRSDPFYLTLVHYLLYFFSFKKNNNEVISLKSYHIESSFYKSHDVKGLKIPQVYYNHADFIKSYFVIVEQDLSLMEDAQPDGFTFEDSKEILARLAKFHASNWGKRKNIEGWEWAAYWTEEKECKKVGIGKKWKQVIKNFPELNLHKYSELGKAIEERYDWIKKELGEAKKARETICHGDYKISNIFLNKFVKNTEEKHVYVIDWQWFGYGNCSVDVVSFLNCSLKSDCFSQLGALLEHYYQSLLKYGVTGYTFESFQHDYNVYLVEFVVFCIAGKWSKMTPETFQSYEAIRKDGLHLRKQGHLLFLVSQVDTYIKSLDPSRTKKKRKDD